MGTQELPEGWGWTTFMDACQYLATGIGEYDGKIEYYSTGSIKEGNYVPEGKYPFSKRPSRANRMAQTGDIFQARMAETNKALLVSEDLNKKLFSTGFIQLRPFDCCPGMSSYIYYYLQSNDFLRQRDAYATGTTQVALTDREVRKIVFPFAPLPEQHRIVTKIEELFTKLDAGVEALKKVKAELKRYRQSVLKAAMEGKLTEEWREVHKEELESASVLLECIKEERKEKLGKNYKEPAPVDTGSLPELPEGWDWASVELLAANEPYSITDGPFGSNLKTSHYTESGPRVIRLQNIGDGEFIDEKAHISKNHFETLRKYEIHQGDLVIAALGVDLPHACIIPGYVGPAIVKADCIRFKPHHDFVDRKYVNAALNAEYLKRFAKKIIHGVGRPRLNQKQIKSLPLPLPCPLEQLKIVEEIESRLSVTDNMEEVVDQSLKRAERLRQSILQKAFEGNLVPQDPDDEPASVLLERIKAEKARREAESNAQKRRITKKKRKKKTRIEKMGLYETLKSSKRPLTPSELLKLSKLDIENFNEQLKIEIENKRIIERRPTKRDILLEVER